MSEYELVRRLGPGVALIRREDFRGGSYTSIWGRRRLRKDAVCAASKRLIPKGQPAYGPVGNESFRSDRIDARLIDGDES